MSELVKSMLEKYGLLNLTSHEDRKEIDRIIEDRTDLYCDEGVKMLSEDEFLSIVESVLRRRKKKRKEENIAYT